MSSRVDRFMNSLSRQMSNRSTSVFYSYGRNDKRQENVRRIIRKDPYYTYFKDSRSISQNTFDDLRSLFATESYKVTSAISEHGINVQNVPTKNQMKQLISQNVSILPFVKANSATYKKYNAILNVMPDLKSLKQQKNKSSRVAKMYQIKEKINKKNINLRDYINIVPYPYTNVFRSIISTPSQSMIKEYAETVLNSNSDGDVENNIFKRLMTQKYVNMSPQAMARKLQSNLFYESREHAGLRSMSLLGG